MKIGDKIAKLRKDNNMTQEKLGDLLHVSYKTISSWENNINLPNIEMLLSIAQVFNISIDSLVDDSNNLIRKNNIKKYISIFIFMFISLIYFIIELWIYSGSIGILTNISNADLQTILSTSLRNTIIFISSIYLYYIFATLIVFILKELKNKKYLIISLICQIIIFTIFLIVLYFGLINIFILLIPIILNIYYLIKIKW